MKISFKLTAAALAAITVMSCASLTSFADKLKTVDGVIYRYSDSGERKGVYTGFVKTSKVRKYYKNGVPYKSKHFKTKSGKSYLTDKNGYIVTGWKKIKGAWHWFRENGAEATGYVSVLGVDFQFEKNGEWRRYSDELFDTIYRYFDINFPKEILGGILFDDQKLIVMTTDVDEAKKNIPAFYPEIEVRECKYSYEQLETTLDILDEKWTELFPYTHMITYFDVINNQVIANVDEIHDDLVAFVNSLEYGECVKLCEVPPVLDD